MSGFLSNFREILLQIDNVLEALNRSKVSNFGYLNTITEDELDSGTFSMQNVNNIPSISDTELTEFEVSKGYRTLASTIAKNALNHFWGRASVTLNFLVSVFIKFISEYRAQLKETGNFVVPSRQEDNYSFIPDTRRDFILENSIVFVNDGMTPSNTQGMETGDRYLRNFRPSVVTSANLNADAPLLPSDFINQEFKNISYNITEGVPYSGFSKTSYGYKSTFFSSNFLEITDDYVLNFDLPEGVTSNSISQSTLYLISNAAKVTTLSLQCSNPGNVALYFAGGNQDSKLIQIYIPAKSRQMLYFTIVPRIKSEVTLFSVFINYLPY